MRALLALCALLAGCASPTPPPACPEEVEPYGRAGFFEMKAVPCGVIVEDGVVVSVSKSWRDVGVRVGDRVLSGSFEAGSIVVLSRWEGNAEWHLTLDLGK